MGTPTATPRVWPPARRAVETLFAAVARVQGGRAFHPRGVVFTARIEQTGRRPDPLPAGDGTALVRLSKGAGLPGGLPDVHGLAFRLPDVFGPGRHQDVLLSTAAAASPGLRHVLMPATGVDRRYYSSLMPYRHLGRALLLGARYAGAHGSRAVRLEDLDGAPPGRLVFDIEAARPWGPVRTVARLTLDRRLPDAEAKRLRFHPWNTSALLRPMGPLSHLRAPAYDASQRTAASP